MHREKYIYARSSERFSYISGGIQAIERQTFSAPDNAFLFVTSEPHSWCVFGSANEFDGGARTAERRSGRAGQIVLIVIELI